MSRRTTHRWNSLRRRADPLSVCLFVLREPADAALSLTNLVAVCLRPSTTYPGVEPPGIGKPQNPCAFSLMLAVSDRRERVLVGVGDDDNRSVLVGSEPAARWKIAELNELVSNVTHEHLRTHFALFALHSFFWNESRGTNRLGRRYCLDPNPIIVVNICGCWLS